MDNTPVSGNQEDHVSMSAQSAFDARAAVENAITVVGIELLCGAQAAEFVSDDLAHGVGTAAAYETVRDAIPPLVEDRPIHGDIESADALVWSGLLEQRVEDALTEALE
jgi:histidine ammonia-lyase